MNVPKFKVIPEENYDDMLNCLFPRKWIGDAFLVGEAYDCCPLSGATRFTMCMKYDDKCVEAMRPVTTFEFDFIVSNRPPIVIE